eukprot:scaffold192849_cov32-Tisochrysis_lutea.AAC.1
MSNRLVLSLLYVLPSLARAGLSTEWSGSPSGLSTHWSYDTLLDLPGLNAKARAEYDPQVPPLSWFPSLLSSLLLLSPSISSTHCSRPAPSTNPIFPSPSPLPRAGAPIFTSLNLSLWHRARR